MLLLGVGGGLSFPALMTLAMSEATPSDAGLASGLVSTSAQVGGAIGLAVLATLSAGQTNALLTSGVDLVAALVSGYRLAFVVGAGLLIAAIVVAATLLRPSPRAQNCSMGHDRAVHRVRDQAISGNL
jgi:MFS family permease